jgi:excisionase family DNA binding protein
VPFVDEPRAEIGGVSALILTFVFSRRGVRDAVMAYGLTDAQREAVLEDLDAVERAARAYADGGGRLADPRDADDGTAALPQDDEPSSSFTMTVNEAADVLGLGPRRVRDMCRDRELPARQAGRIWMLDPSGVKLEVARRANAKVDEVA